MDRLAEARLLVARAKTVEPKDPQTYWLRMFPYADPRSRAEIEAALTAAGL
jgi:hypothetical protein